MDNCFERDKAYAVPVLKNIDFTGQFIFCGEREAASVKIFDSHRPASPASPA